MGLDDTLKRYSKRVTDLAETPKARGFAGGAVAGLVLSELATGDTLEELGFEVDDVTHSILDHVERIGGRLAHGYAMVSSLSNPGSPEGIAAIGLASTTRWRTRPRRRRTPPKATGEAETGPQRFPDPVNDGGSIVDRADRMYRIYKFEVPDTDGTETKYQKLGEILNVLTVQGSHDPTVAAMARSITVGAFGPEAKARAVGEWVQKKIVYIHDEDMPYKTLHPEFVETEWNGALEVFQDAKRTLDCGYGDCDCRVILVTSMLRSLGVYTFFRLISQTDPEVYGHIYNVVGTGPGSFLAVDTTPVNRGEQGWVFHPIGWEAGYTGRCDIYPQLLPGMKALPFVPPD